MWTEYFFDVPISTTGSIKELLGHYGKVKIYSIKTQEEIINTDNDRREKEYDKLYTYLM